MNASQHCGPPKLDIKIQIQKSKKGPWTTGRKDILYWAARNYRPHEWLQKNGAVDQTDGKTYKWGVKMRYWIISYVCFPHFLVTGFSFGIDFKSGRWYVHLLMPTIGSHIQSSLESFLLILVNFIFGLFRISSLLLSCWSRQLAFSIIRKYDWSVSRICHSFKFVQNRSKIFW